MTWLDWLYLNTFELIALVFVWLGLFFWTRTVEWYVAVTMDKSWFVRYGGGVALIPFSCILYFTHARKYLKEQEKRVDKK